LVDDKWVNDEFIPRVQKRGAEIIAARQLSSAASAADAAIKHMKDWVQGSNEVVSMAIPSDGSYGVKSGIYCSFPVVCSGNGKYTIVQNLTLNENIKKRIAETVKELEQEKSDVKDMIKTDRFKK
jgi:malate dehydrogenase